VILDRDGVLNRRPPQAQYVRSRADFEWLPGALASLEMLHAAGYRVVVVSNQAGIARGAMSEADLAEIHRAMEEEAGSAGGRIDGVYYCPHDWDARCECRKPMPGMLFQAQRDFNLDLSRTYFIGDDERDGEAAQRAGCLFAKVSQDRPLIDWVKELLNDPTTEEKQKHENTSLDHGA
jgi:D-glycero-D-manno-heptose 1,7-bisphosphate phosphatase